MEEWERAFLDKSERRRRRSRRNRLLRRLLLVSAISILILLGLWVVDNSITVLPALDP